MDGAREMDMDDTATPPATGDLHQHMPAAAVAVGARGRPPSLSGGAFLLRRPPSLPTCSRPAAMKPTALLVSICLLLYFQMRAGRQVYHRSSASSRVDAALTCRVRTPLNSDLD